LVSVFQLAVQQGPLTLSTLVPCKEAVVVVLVALRLLTLVTVEATAVALSAEMEGVEQEDTLVTAAALPFQMGLLAQEAQEAEGELHTETV
jgi:hypothetical protein